MERILLLVDDEENILSSLTRLLRRDGYTILKANGGAAGLEVLKDNVVGVIISDQRMPEMTGIEFLSKVKTFYPETIRIVLSGYTDLKSVTDAINEGAIYKFLTKPWDDELLREEVKGAFRNYELARDNVKLGNELTTANEELARLLKQQHKFTDINLQVLKISQEIMEHLPMAIIGVDDEGMVALANLKAHEMLNCSGGMVGLTVDKILPDVLLDIYVKNQHGDIGHEESMITLGNQMEVQSIISTMGEESRAKGRIIVLVPQGEG